MFKIVDKNKFSSASETGAEEGGGQNTTNNGNPNTGTNNSVGPTIEESDEESLLRLRPVVRLPNCLNVATPYVRVLTGVNGFSQNPLCWDSISGRRLAAFG